MKNVNNLEIRFLGAIGSVTGSSTHLRYTDSEQREFNYLVDAGVLQAKGSTNQAKQEILNLAKKLDGIFITHSHIDHIGLIPDLICEGFNGNIYCTKATSDLIRIMLEDYLNIQGKRNESKYILDKINFLNFDNNDEYYQFGRSYTRLTENFKVGVLRTSHILGSVAYYFKWMPNPDSSDKWKTIHFSGDLGSVSQKKNSTLISKEWQYPYFQEEENSYVIESTYGNRVRGVEYNSETRLEKLEEIISDAMLYGKHIIIPVFAQHRAQELLLDLYYLKNKKEILGPSYTYAYFTDKEDYSIR